VGVLKKGGNRFSTKKKVKKTILKICDFFWVFFFGRVFFGFLLSLGRKRAYMPNNVVAQAYHRKKRRLQPVSLPLPATYLLPAWLPACLPPASKQPFASQSKRQSES
jgi:hypothetical protein